MTIAIAKYVLIAGVLAGAGFGIYQLVSDDQPEPAPTTPEESLPPLPTDDPDLDFSPVPEEPSPTPSGTAAATPTASPIASPTSTASPAPAGGRRIQVLDGANSGPRAARAVQELETAGYDIAATAATSRPYDKTTVFYQPGNEQAARDVAAVVGAADVLVAPQNLDKSIPLAVVIGADYAG